MQKFLRTFWNSLIKNFHWLTFDVLLLLRIITVQKLFKAGKEKVEKRNFGKILDVWNPYESSSHLYLFERSPSPQSLGHLQFPVASFIRQLTLPSRFLAWKENRKVSSLLQIHFIPVVPLLRFFVKLCKILITLFMQISFFKCKWNQLKSYSKKLLKYLWNITMKE